MRRRRPLRTAALVVVIILIGLFVVVGIPLIRDTFTPPITGLPTVVNAGNSLRDRYTQTALARQATTNVSETPPAATK